MDIMCFFKKYSSHLFVLFVISFGFLLTTNVEAAVCTWTAASSSDPNNMSNLDNWSGGCTLAPTDDLVFDTTTTAATMDGTFTGAINSLTTNAAYTGTITIASGASTVIETGNINGSATINNNSTGGLVFSSGLTFAGAAGAATFNNAGILVISSGSLDISGSQVIFTNTGGTLILGGGLINVGTFTDTSGTVIASSTSANFGGAGNTTLYNLSVSSTLTLTGNVTTTNVLTINNGHTLSAATYTINLTKSSGTPFILSGSGVFTSVSSTVVYSGSSDATIATTTYYNLTINSAGTLGGPVTTTNNLTVNSGKSLALGVKNLIVGGNFDNSGVITQTAGGVTMTGASSNLGGSGNTTVASLTISGGTITLAGNVTSTGGLIVNGSKIFNLSTYNLVVDSGIDNGGTITQTSGTFTMTGTGNINNSGVYLQFAALNIGGTATLTGSGNVTTTATTTISGTLNGNEDNILTLAGPGTPLVITGTFNINTSTVIYTSSTANITPFTYYNLTIDGTDTLAGNVTTTNVLTINSSKSLNASTYTINISATGTPFVNNGTFTSSSSTVNYTSTGSVTTTGGTYWNLALGAGIYSISDNTTSTNSFTNAGTSTIASGKTLSAPGTFDNNGTFVETGIIKHTMTSSTLSDSSGTEKSSYASGADTVYVTIRDDDGNLNASSVDTISVGTGSAITTDGYNDSESITGITLTETGADTGIFVGTAYPFQVVAAKTNNNSQFDVSGSGTLTLAFVDDKDATDTGADTAAFTGSTYTAPSSGGGSSAAAVAPKVISPSMAIKIKNGLIETISQKITLELEATGANLMAISNLANFFGASWENYAISKEWLLPPGDGEKTVYVKFRSATGGETAIYSVKIMLKSGVSLSEVNQSVVGDNKVAIPDLLSSAIAITGITKFTYAPYARIKYTYAYQNTGDKTAKTKVVRQLLNSKGKVVKSSSAVVSLKSGATFKRNISESVLGTVGKYTVKIRILDAKNKLLEENLFSYNVAKPKKK